MTTLSAPSSTLLRRALQGNGAFSTLIGLVTLLGANAVAAFTGIQPAVVFIVLGLSLLLFAAGLFWMTRETAVNPTLARIVIGLDVLWVAGSIILLLSNALPLTVAGKWAIGLVADMVALFAILQYIGLRRATA
ncbi:MAG: hypothetical protein AAF614_06455 [Chloroflexota bacterium]